MTHAKSHRRRGAMRNRMGALLALAFVIALGFLAYSFAHRHLVHFTVDMRQHAMFAPVEAALELFDNRFGGYPPSDANDAVGASYCGVMKLTEAMVGQDQMGFHPKSAFRADGLDPDTLAPLYTADTLKARLGLFLPIENANVFKVVDIYGKGNAGPSPEDTSVMCDVFGKERPSGKKTGMPILYYRAHLSRTKHDPNNPDDPENIYNYRDNLALLRLGVPGDPSVVHPLADPKRFYLNTQNTQVSSASRPYRAHSYILISAGPDGLYGTADDVCNFTWQYRER